MFKIYIINLYMLACAKLIAAGLAVLALGGTSLGISNVFSSLISSFSRNPSLKGQLFSYAILGFALVEAMGLFALMMAFLFIYG